MVKVSKSGVLV